MYSGPYIEGSNGPVFAKIGGQFSRVALPQNCNKFYFSPIRILAPKLVGSSKSF